MNITVFRVYQLNLLTAISMYMKSLFYLFLSIVGKGGETMRVKVRSV